MGWIGHAYTHCKPNSMINKIQKTMEIDILIIYIS